MSDVAENPFFSIVIPHFADRENLLRCLKSIEEQEFRDFEVIVVDDASPENPFPLSESKLEASLKEIRLERNAGPGVARSAGLDAAIGRYVAFIDSDDLYFEWSLEVFADQLVKAEYPEMLISRFYVTREIVPDELPGRFLPATDAFESVGAYLEKHSPPLTSAIVMRRDILEELGGFDEKIRLWEEYDLLFRLPNKSTLLYLRRPLGVVKVHGEDRETYNFPASVEGGGVVVDRELEGFYQADEEISAARRASIVEALRWYVQQSEGTEYQQGYKALLAKMSPASTDASETESQSHRLLRFLLRIVRKPATGILSVLLSVSLLRTVLRRAFLFVAQNLLRGRSRLRHLAYHIYSRALRSGTEGAIQTTAFGALYHHKPDSYLHSMLMSHGIWEPAVVSIIARGLQQGDCYVDVGANIGVHALLGALCVGEQGRVFAFEPEPACYRELRANIELNHLAQVTSIQGAVGAVEAQLELHIPEGGNEGRASLLAASVRCERATVRVDVRSLRTWLGESEYQNARMIKIDVEGYEWVVLEDVLANVSLLSPDCELLVEMSLSYAQTTNSDCRAIVEEFERHGYTFYELENYYEPEEYARGHILPAPSVLEWDFKSQVDVLISRSTPSEIGNRYPEISVAKLFDFLISLAR